MDRRLEGVSMHFFSVDHRRIAMAAEAIVVGKFWLGVRFWRSAAAGVRKPGTGKYETDDAQQFQLIHEPFTSESRKNNSNSYPGAVARAAQLFNYKLVYLLQALHKTDHSGDFVRRKLAAKARHLSYTSGN